MEKESFPCEESVAWVKAFAILQDIGHSLRETELWMASGYTYCDVVVEVVEAPHLRYGMELEKVLLSGAGEVEVG